MTGCEFEKEISLALREGRWPAAAGPALCQHVAGCSSCSDLVLVTEALQNSRAVAARAAELPPPGILYWRAQLRRRSGAVERMSRPIVFAEVVTLLATLLALAFAASRLTEFFNLTSLLDRLSLADVQLHLSNALAALPAWAPLLLIGALIFFALGGFAVYVLAHND